MEEVKKELVHTQDELTKQLKEALGNIPELDSEKSDESLAEMNLDELVTPKNTTAYTTNLLNELHEIESSITGEQFKSLVDYDLKGGVRPDFADTMLTQIIPKMEDTLKIVALLQLLQLPGLFDRQKTLQENILKPDILQNMTYTDMVDMSNSLQKQINDILQTSLKIISQLSAENRISTRAERVANAFMGLSESCKAKLEEVILEYSDSTN